MQKPADVLAVGDILRLVFFYFFLPILKTPKDSSVTKFPLYKN